MRIVTAMLLIAPALGFAADPAPHAAPSNVPGVYQQYKAPTPAPTPLADSGVRLARVEVHKDTMGVALKGGAAVPLGDMGKFSTTGWSAGMDLIYGASSLVDAAFSVNYASMPYKLTTAAQPQTSLGIGLKAMVKALKDKKLSVSFEGGMGYYMQSVAVENDLGLNLATPDPNDRKTEVKYQNSGGIGFILGIVAAIQFTPNFSMGVSADATQVSLGGGTKDTPLFLVPSLNITYTF